MKKLILLFLPVLFACGMEEPSQSITFSAEEISINRVDVCENMDASTRDELDSGVHERLCGYPKACQHFESELVCEGEWCVIHRHCQVK